MEDLNIPYSPYFRISYKGPPPQVASTWRPSDAFKLPSYEETLIKIEHWQGDSNRLPTYQSHQLHRYHPYWQYNPSCRQDDGLTYQNTVYDDQYVALEVPARVGPPRPTPPLLPLGNATQNTEDELTPGELSGGVSPAKRAQRSREVMEDPWARAQRLRARLGDFLYAMHMYNLRKSRNIRIPSRGVPCAIPK